MNLKIFKILLNIFILQIFLFNSPSFAETSWITKKNENQINKDEKCNINLSIETINLKSDYFIEINDYKNAFICAKIGSDRDNPYAIANLGWHYQTGNGVKKDYKKANKLFKKGIKKSNLYSYNRLAESFINGWGVPKNLNKAISLYRDAADKGDDFAQSELGYFYLHGEGVIKDEKIAYSWFKKSADQNNTFAQSNLGWLLLMGKGVEIDYEEAFKYSKLAADKGNNFAQANVAYHYEFGEGVDKNIDKAIEYYSLSADQNNEYAKERLDNLLINDDDLVTAESTFITKKKKDSKKIKEKIEIENTEKITEDNLSKSNDDSINWITKNNEKINKDESKKNNQSEFVLIDEERKILVKTRMRKNPSVESDTILTLEKDLIVWALKKLRNTNTRNEFVFIEAEVKTKDGGKKIYKGYVLADKLENFIDHKKEKEPKYDIEWGTYYAIVIGNNDYILENSGLNPLKTAINDAKKIGEILKNKYGFEVEVVSNASRSDVYNLFKKYRNIITEKDNLLIYYAGHGFVEPSTKEGYWQTIGGKKNDESTWLSASELVFLIRGFKAKHVMVIADSCFSGSLFNEVTWRGEENELNLESLFKKKNKKITRVALSSGNYELVPDSVDDSDHSPFASTLINILESNEDVLLAHNLYSKIEIEITKYSRQTPVYGEFDLKTHQQTGDFIFVPKKLR